MFTITAKSVPGILGKVENIFNDNNIPILNINQYQDKTSQYTLLKVFVSCPDVALREKVIHELCEVDLIKEIYTSKKSYHHDSE